MVIAVVMTSAVSARSPVRATTMAIPMQPPESPPVTLTLQCMDSTTIRFEITNVGSADTALPLGRAVANGRTYMIDHLNLRMKPSNGNGTDYEYLPRHYRAVTGGRFDLWFQA